MLTDAFTSSQMGMTQLDLPKDYTQTLVLHCRTLSETYQRIIDEDYPPAKEWSELFYQGGKARDGLAKMARFGELQDEHTEALQTEITAWSKGVDVSTRTLLWLVLG